MCLRFSIMQTYNKEDVSPAIVGGLAWSEDFVCKMYDCFFLLVTSMSVVAVSYLFMIFFLCFW